MAGLDLDWQLWSQVAPGEKVMREVSDDSLISWAALTDWPWPWDDLPGLKSRWRKFGCLMSCAIFLSFRDFHLKDISVKVFLYKVLDFMLETMFIGGFGASRPLIRFFIFQCSSGCNDSHICIFHNCTLVALYPSYSSLQHAVCGCSGRGFQYWPAGIEWVLQCCRL